MSLVFAAALDASSESTQHHNTRRERAGAQGREVLDSKYASRELWTDGPMWRGTSFFFESRGSSADDPAATTLDQSVPGQ